MPEALPELIWPRRLARSGLSVSGRLPLSGMTRLREMTFDPGGGEAPGEVEVELHFELDSSGRPRVRGRVATQVEMSCQRCLERMSVPIEAITDLVVVEEGGAPGETEGGAEPLEVGEEPISLAALVEDELLLAAPAFAAHPPGRCAAPATPAAPAHEDVAAEPRDNPFALLRDLKGDGP